MSCFIEVLPEEDGTFTAYCDYLYVRKNYKKFKSIISLQKRLTKENNREFIIVSFHDIRKDIFLENYELYRNQCKISAI